MTTRPLNKSCLDQAVRDYAGRFLLPSVYSRVNPERAIDGRDWVIQSMYQFHYKDEFDHILAGLEGYMGQDAWVDFKAATKDVFTPRREDVFAQELETRLAMRPDGTFIDGKLGTVQIGERVVGHRPKVLTLKSGKEVTIMKPIKEPVYMGDRDFMGSVGAQNFNMSAETAILGLDAIVDNLDEGTGAAVIQGRSGAQPADPDAATTGVLLFTCVMSATAFGAAADQADGTVQAAAAAISDDTSADATNTLGYCRASATNDGATPLDDHIDGEAGTSGADFIFNTVSIVSGANVAISSWTITLDQGTTAT